MTIVFADDSNAYRAGISRALSAHAELELLDAVADGEQALAAIERLAPAVALLDWRMPHLDGIEVCRRLRGSGNAVPIVILSAEMDERLAAAAREAGANAWLSKSASRREICATVIRAAREVD